MEAEVCDVLVVEHDAALRRAITRFLAVNGWSFVSVIDGATALARLREGLSPRLMLLDLMSPVVDGCATLAAVRADANLRSLHVVTLSATCPDAAADGHLPKPVEVDALLAVVAAATSDRCGSRSDH